MAVQSPDRFDDAYRPVLVCTVVWGLMIVSMLGFLGSTVADVPPAVTRHAVAGFRLTYFAFTFYIVLLGLLYAFGKLLSTGLRLAVNASAAVVFIFAFSVVGDEFGSAFNELPNIGPIGFSGSAVQAILAIVSLPIATLALLTILAIGRGARRVRVKIAARNTSDSLDNGED